MSNDTRRDDQPWEGELPENIWSVTRWVIVERALIYQSGRQPTSSEVARRLLLTFDELAKAEEEITLRGYWNWVGFGQASAANPNNRVAIPVALRWEVWERDNFTCQHCGTRRFLSIDHIAPVSRGGPTTSDNLQTLCTRCNSQKGAR